MKKILFVAVFTFLAFNANAQVSDTVKTSEEKFAPVDVAPEFVGGIPKLSNYIKKNQRAINDQAYGRVMITFIIEKDGSLTDIKVIRSLSPATDAEAIRLIKKMPNWNPGIQNGTPVRVQFTMPIIFP